MSLPSLHDLPLPDYARPDLAFQEVIKLPATLSGARILYRVPGSVFCYPIALTFGLTTDGNVANRHVLMLTLDQDAAEIARVISPVTQPQSSTWVYNFLSTLSTAYGAVASNVAVPTPPTIVPPDWRIGIQVNTLQVGDTAILFTLTCIHIPTGPLRESSSLLSPIPNHVLEAA